MSAPVQNGERRTGRCLCGAVRYDVRLARPEIQICHCGQCRRWTGGPGYFAVSVEDARIEGADKIVHHRLSEWGERAFCGACGATLYWRMQGGPVTNVAAGGLDDQTGLAVGEEIFTDRRADWIAPWPHASQSTEAEEMAKLDAHLAASPQT